MRNRQKGFTIVELMIATTVFSFVLLVASSGVIAIGRLYYKGVTASRTQEVARIVMEDVSRARQFSGGDMSTGGTVGSTQSICFGQDRYSYYFDSPSPDALRYDVRPSLSTCDPITAGGKPLLSSNMRLLDFQVTSIGQDKFSVKVKVAYGDNDLLSTYQDDGTTPTGVATSDAECKGGVGSNFCAVSELATVVNKRIK